MKNQVTLRMQSYCRGKDSKPLTSCADMFKVCQQSSLRPAGHRHAAVGGTACSWILALCEVAHTDTRHAWCHAPNYKTCRCARDTVKRLRDNSTQLAAVHVQSASKQLTGVMSPGNDRCCGLLCNSAKGHRGHAAHCGTKSCTNT